MTDLILTAQKTTMTSVEIAELVESRHDKVKQSINRLVKKGIIPQPPMGDGEKSQNGIIPKVYFVDERSSYIVVAQLSPEFTAKLVDHWQATRDKSLVIPKTLPEALRLYADQLDITAKQEKLIAEQKPKALFADAVSSSVSSILIGQMAKLICQNGVNIGQNRLFEWMRNNGYLVKQHGESWNLPTQRSMDGKWLEVKERVVENKDGSTRITRTTKVTGKGQVYFVNKFLSEV